MNEWGKDGSPYSSSSVISYTSIAYSDSLKLLKASKFFSFANNPRDETQLLGLTSEGKLFESFLNFLSFPFLLLLSFSLLFRVRTWMEFQQFTIWISHRWNFEQDLQGEGNLLLDGIMDNVAPQMEIFSLSPFRKSVHYGNTLIQESPAPGSPLTSYTQPGPSNTLHVSYLCIIGTKNGHLQVFPLDVKQLKIRRLSYNWNWFFKLGLWYRIWNSGKGIYNHRPSLFWDQVDRQGTVSLSINCMALKNQPDSLTLKHFNSLTLSE